MLTYALNEAGKMVGIDSVETGLSCKCRCPKCKEFLIAKQGHGVRKPHFAHQGNINCHGSYMSALHKLAEQIIEKEKAVMAPEYKEMKAQKLSFVNTELERRVDRNDVQPDVVGVTDDGLRWHIEIRNTSEVDESKKAKLLESNLTCLEIDVRKQELDEDNLKSFLFNSTEERKWINNPNYESLIKAGKIEISQKYQADSSFEIKTKGACSSKCKYGLINGKCIYMIESLSYKGIDFVVCDALKRQKDEEEAILQNKNADDAYTRHETSNKTYGNTQKRKIINLISSFLKNAQMGDLPFDRYWTIESFYEHLNIAVPYEYELNHLVEVEKCDVIRNGILVLLKETSEEKILWPFHIVTISVNNGIIKYNKGNDYPNKTVALKAYDESIRYYQSNAYNSQTSANNDLPF